VAVGTSRGDDGKVEMVPDKPWSSSAGAPGAGNTV